MDRCQTDILQNAEKPSVVTNATSLPDFVWLLMCFTLTAWGMSQFPQVGLESWQRAMEHYQIQNADAFRRVAVIHFAGYLGAGVGLILALWDTRTQVRQSQNQSIKMLNEENKAGQGVTE